MQDRLKNALAVLAASLLAAVNLLAQRKSELKITSPTPGTVFAPSIAACNQSSSCKAPLWVAIVTLLAATACNPFRPAIREKIVEGRQFAHDLRFSSGFGYPASREPDFYFDHLMFRVSRSSPDVLVAAGCGYLHLKESCSSNAFLVDTAHGYAVNAARSGEWERANSFPGADGLRNPNGYSPPYPLRELASNGPQSGAYIFREKAFNPRGNWITALILQASGDGNLVLLAGADLRKLPSSGMFFGGPVSDGRYGNVTLDTFDWMTHASWRRWMWIAGWRRWTAWRMSASSTPAGSPSRWRRI